MDPVYYLTAWQSPRATSNSAAKKILQGRDKSIGSPEEIDRLRSDVMAVLGPGSSVTADFGLLLVTLPEARLREASGELLAAFAAAGYQLFDPQVGRLVVPMTQMAAPWPPVRTGPIAELRESLAAASTRANDAGESGLLDLHGVVTDLAAEKGWTVWRVGDPIPPEMDRGRHIDPELESMIPAGLVESADSPTSVRATDWGAPAISRALKAVGVRPRDAQVISAIGGKRQTVHSVTIFRVAGIAADALEVAFEPAIFKPRSVRWQRRDIEGRSVRWAEAKGYLQGQDFAAAWWTRDGLVVWITGQPAWLESAITRLP